MRAAAVIVIGLAVIVIGLALGGCSSAPAHGTIASCAKAIEQQPDSSHWSQLGTACKGLTYDQKTQATLLAMANGATG